MKIPNEHEQAPLLQWMSRLAPLHLHRVEDNIKGPSEPTSPHQSTTPQHPARTPNFDHSEPPQRLNSPPPNILRRKPNTVKNKQTTTNKSTNKITVNDKQKQPRYICTKSCKKSNKSHARNSHTTTTTHLNKLYEGLYDRPRNEVPPPRTTPEHPTEPLVETVCDNVKPLPSATYDPMADAPDPAIPTPSYVPLH